MLLATQLLLAAAPAAFMNTPIVISRAPTRMPSLPYMSTALVSPSPSVPELPMVKTNAVSRLFTKVNFIVASVVAILIWYVPLLPLTLYSLKFDNVRRRGCDWVVQAKPARRSSALHPFSPCQLPAPPVHQRVQRHKN